MTRSIGRAVALAAIAFTGACSADATAPVAPRPTRAVEAQADIATTLTALRTYFETAVLERAQTLPADVSVSKTIGSQGGTVAIPELGFELIVPKGAVSKNTVFTVTALAGKSIAYDFGPHGMKFKQPLTFRQNATHTTGWWNAASGGYFKSRDQVDTGQNRAKVDETISMKWDGFWMTFEVQHFSGYLVSCA